MAQPLALSGHSHDIKIGRFNHPCRGDRFQAPRVLTLDDFRENWSIAAGSSLRATRLRRERFGAPHLNSARDGRRDDAPPAPKRSDADN